MFHYKFNYFINYFIIESETDCQSLQDDQNELEHWAEKFNPTNQHLTITKTDLGLVPLCLYHLDASVYISSSVLAEAMAEVLGDAGLI